MRNDENPTPKAADGSLGKGDLLVLGAGQYGVMAAEIAKSMGAFDRIAFLDDSFLKTTGADLCEEQGDGVVSKCNHVIGSLSDIERFATNFRFGFVAIGNPALRRKLTEQLLANGFSLATLVHPTAYVSPSAKLQKGCCVEPLATIQTGAVIGGASFVASGAVIRHNATVGEYSHVDCNAVVETLAEVPAGTHVACGSVFTREKGILNA